MDVVFEFGQTTESEAFFDRNPKFYPAFERLGALINKCFGRPIQAKNRTEDVCFSLGETCREDFIEILFLATNGYATGESKLLRGLYGRAVALALHGGKRWGQTGRTQGLIRKKPVNVMSVPGFPYDLNSRRCVVGAPRPTTGKT